uniref:Phosphatidylethanolamine-binding protein n=1 Tax=Heterorhabditis bacteriophora TaxID=37862 RepID=A0A1I7XPT8_HETBA
MASAVLHRVIRGTMCSAKGRLLLSAVSMTLPPRCFASMIEEAFKSHQVVPDVIAAPPSKTVMVTYDSGVEASLGNILTPTQVQNPPSLSWDFEDGALYTVLLTGMSIVLYETFTTCMANLFLLDPDAPSRKEATFREWHHWLIVNIPGDNLKKGDVLADYIGSGPPKGTGLHRYVFLVYKQNTKIIDEEHGKLNLTKYINSSRYYVKFQAEWDNYVPILYKKLGS